MPQQLLPPDIRRMIHDLELRISALERRLRMPAGPTPDEIIFTYPGTLAATESPPVQIADGKPVTFILASLGTAGTSATVVELRRDGTVVASLTIPSGQMEASTPTAIGWGADQDFMTVKIATVGTGARNLTVQVRFA